MIVAVNTLLSQSQILVGWASILCDWIVMKSAPDM
jgi:hypothetical protein